METVASTKVHEQNDIDQLSYRTSHLISYTVIMRLSLKHAILIKSLRRIKAIKIRKIRFIHVKTAYQTGTASRL